MDFYDCGGSELNKPQDYHTILINHTQDTLNDLNNCSHNLISNLLRPGGAYMPH